MKKLLCCLLSILLVLSLCLTACSPGQGADSEILRQKSQVEDSVLSAQASALESGQPAESDVSAAAEDVSETEMSQREKNWREDFAYFKETYVETHPDPFLYMSEEEFDFQVEQLSQKVDKLSDTDICYEFTAIVAGFLDNHTLFHGDTSMYDRIFPICTDYYSDKLYITRYAKGYEEFAPYLLHEIVAVNGVDIKYLQKKADTIWAPNNLWCGQAFFYSWNGLQPAFVDWATGHAKDEYTLEVLDDDGQVVSLDLPVMEHDPSHPELVEMIWYDTHDKVSHLQETGVTYFETEKGNLVYLAFIGGLEYTPGTTFYKELMQQTADLLKEHPNSKFVVDLRRNPGGLSNVFIDVQNATKSLQETYIPETYVITGGGSTSLAIRLLTYYKQRFRAIHVGEPTGQSTSFWTHAYKDESERYNYEKMPHSGISFVVSNLPIVYPNENACYDENGKLYEWENTVLPDVYVSMDVEDVKEGKDTVIEWILEH